MRLTPILHSVSYAGTWGQTRLTPDAFVNKAADLGFRGVMLMAKRPHLSVLDYGQPERAALRATIERRGLDVVSIAGYTNFTADLEHSDIPLIEMQIQHVTELARLASDLGGSLVRIFTGYDNPARKYGEQWNLIVAALRECAQRASDFGVIIGVQNHHDIGVGYQTHYDLIRQVDHPNCRAMFDAWAPALQGADIVAAARAMGSVAVQTTIADYVLRPRYKYNPAIVNYVAETPAVQAVLMGQGIIDYRGFLSELMSAGFSGPVAYEMCSPLLEGGSEDVLDRYARAFLEYMQGLERTSTTSV